jgi:hypothetical protein
VNFHFLCGNIPAAPAYGVSKTEKKTTQKPKTYTKDDYHGPIKTGVRPGVPAE